MHHPCLQIKAIGQYNLGSMSWVIQSNSTRV